MFVAPRSLPPVAAKALAVALALAPGMLGALGCNDKALESSASMDAGKRLGSAITPEQAAKVLAKVGDHTITLGDFVAAIEHMDQFDRLRYQSPERRRELLAEMINMQLLADEAQAKGYDKDPRVQQEIRGILRDSMLAESHKGAMSANELSEADVRAYYDKNRASFREPERRRLSVIVLPDRPSAAAVLEDAKKTTTAVQWGEIVRAKSTDAAAKANVPIDLVGDFGLVSAPGEPQGEPNVKVPPEVRDAVFKIAKIRRRLRRRRRRLGPQVLRRPDDAEDGGARAHLRRGRALDPRAPRPGQGPREGRGAHRAAEVRVPGPDRRRRACDRPCRPAAGFKRGRR